MSSDRYFLRIRGRVTGPYSLLQLQDQVRRRELSRLHEISADKANWFPAGGIAELFGPTQPTSTHAAAQQSSEGDDEEVIPLELLDDEDE